MHASEIKALNKDFDHILAKIADLEERVSELERQNRMLNSGWRTG